MTDPRIGDTVHVYGPHNDRCMPAIVVEHREASTLGLTVIGRGVTTWWDNTHLDPGEFTDEDGNHWMPDDDRTSGTWHHIH